MSARTITLQKPDDWHIHLRDGAMLKAVVPATARQFGRAIIMPNLRPPVTTTARAKTYRDEIMAALPSGVDFTPLMTVYLTDSTDADDLAQGYADGVLTAAKLYPANATTNAEHGVSDVQALAKAFERMQRIGMPLLIHGEVTDPAVDIFDREAVFIERVLSPLRRNFPELKVVLEHITTRQAAEYVVAEGQSGKLAATITAHHLRINRNAIFTGGLRPHYYCLPVAKRETHRQALVQAATSGGSMFFLGTDSAPHPRTTKESACGCAGIFTAINALELYVQVFDEQDALDRFEAFASINGPNFYGLPVNNSVITLEKTTEPSPPLKSILTGDGAEILPFHDDTPVVWRMVETQSP